MTDNTYQPAKVWTWDKSAGGAFANINRPVSGPTHEKTLPVGKHPLQLYSLGTPNGQKVTIMLEEDRKSTRLNSSHVSHLYAVFCVVKINKHMSKEFIATYIS